MADTKKLYSMLDDMINDKTDQSQVNFHEYLKGRMQEVVAKVLNKNNEPELNVRKGADNG